MTQHPTSASQFFPASEALPPSTGRRGLLRCLAGGAALASTGLLGGCGFALRQSPKFAFESLQVSNQENTVVSRALQRALSTSGVQVYTTAGAAPAPGQLPQVVLNVLVDQRERAVVGQTDSGQVREMQLRTRFRFTLSTQRGKRLIEESELLLERDISYTETAALAKATEEQLMYTDMVNDMVQQLMRRLAAVKSL
jgi:LPS-assembly lipoprotein